MTGHEEVLLEVDPEEAASLAQDLAELDYVHVQSFPKRNVTGVEVVLLALQITASVLPMVLTLLDRRRPRKIRVGEIEIENPTDEDLARLRELAGISAPNER